MATKTAALVRMAPVRAQAPIIRVSAPRAPAKPKTKHRRRSSAGARSKSQMFAIAAAGFALGFVDKSGTAIPTIPLLGRAGTIAAGLYFFAPSGGFWADAMVAASAIAGYELGLKGSISGDVSPQVSIRGGGIASQV
jgi:hypothetical protein